MPFLLADSSIPFADSLIAAAAMLGGVYLLMRNNAKNRKKDPLARDSASLSLAQQRSVERQMQSLLVELSEMARQISSQLDSRAAKLELLIKEADEKLEELRLRISDAAAGPSSHSSGGGAGSRDDEDEIPPPIRLHPERPPAPDPRYTEVYSLADQGMGSSQIASRLNRPAGEIELILALRQKRSHS